MSDLLTELRHYTATENYYFHPMYPFLKYTDGFRYFIQNAGKGAYWLLDIIATEPTIRKQAEEFACIKLTVRDNAAVLRVDDGNGTKPVYERVIEYTDCPPGEYRFYWTDEVLLWCLEY
jgi:hypothetical protein